MPSVAPPDRAILRAIAAIALLTLWRVALLPFNEAELFVDDAQYWLWAQDPAWGYFSKPPLVAWIIAVSTGLGSDDPFWIRLPLPLLHAAAALVVLEIGRRLFGPRVGALAGVAYASLPGVALGSLLVSTDTPLLLAFAVATLALLRLGRGPSVGWTVGLGLALGLGLLAKYAMLYFVLGAALAGALLPATRIAWRDVSLAAAVALALVAPNLAWNAANGFATLTHTVDNAGWAGAPLRPLALAEFLAAQFAVAGPFLFAAWLVALVHALRGRADPRIAWLVALSAPVLGVVSAQALIAGANANWAAPAHLGVALAGTALLAPRPRLLAAALGLNLAVSLALPLATTAAASLRAPGGELVFARYLGRGEISRRAADIAAREGLDTIVASSRDVLADLFYTLRDSGLVIRAEPAPGPPAHHYAQRHALEPGPGDVLFVTHRARGPLCRAGVTPTIVARWTLEDGYRSGEMLAFRTPRACWHAAPP